jgi:hypothetical protein
VRGVLLTGDGLVKKPKPDDVFRETRYFDFRVNPPLDDQLFTYTPEEGAELTEEDHRTDPPKSTVVKIPYSPPNKTAQEAQQIETRILELTQKRTGLKNLSGIFVWKIAHSDYFGKFSWKDPCFWNTDFQRALEHSKKTTHEIHFQSGKYKWSAYEDSDRPTKGVRTFLKQDLSRPDSNIAGWMGAMFKEAGASDQKMAELSRKMVCGPTGLPANLLHPLADVKPDRIKYEGPEIFAGRKTEKFLVLPGGRKEPRTEYWIDSQHGFISQMYSYDLSDRIVEGKFEVKEYTANAPLPDSAFTVTPGPKIRVDEFSMDRVRKLTH